MPTSSGIPDDVFQSGMPVTLKRRWSYLTALCITLLGALVFMLIPRRRPPYVALEKAESALNFARQTASARYAEEMYGQAEKAMATGRVELARQSGRFAFLRDYTAADSLLNLAADLAHQAAFEAHRNLASLDSLTHGEQNDLEEKVALFKEALEGTLLKLKASTYWYQADLYLTMSRQLTENGEFEASLQTLEKGREELSRLSEVLASYNTDESQMLTIWRTWVRQTIANSRRQKTYAVIVDKSAHKAYLVKSGELMHTYTCELGYNSAHQKLFMGDGATPEGLYRVSTIKNRNSKHYKALLLDYPNSSDRKRFQENKRKGFISQHARIGGLIEIHGNGGEKKDWTEGCIALTNTDMDHIMQYTMVGTPVTIVRSSDMWP